MITIILTSTVHVNFKKHFLVQVNANDRLQTYLKSVYQWLEKTIFHIILVENSREISIMTTNHFTPISIVLS